MGAGMAEAAEVPITVIAPRKGWAGFGFAEVWEFRELLWVLARRDIKVRYTQTVLGAAWAVIQPLTTMVVFSVVFGTLAKIPSDGLPYPIFAFAALVPWGYFSHTLGGISGSIVGYGGMLSKVYFPRLIPPLVPILSGLVDFSIAMAVLGGLMAWFGIAPTAAIVALPALLLLAMVTALSVGIWIAALNVHYRDFRYVVPFLTQLWFYASPVAYPSSLVPERWRALYGINPMASVIEGFRWALLGKGTPPGPMLWVSVAVVVLLLLTGLMFFRRMERTFVDVV